MSRDFLTSWRDRVKQRHSENAELKALQEELDKTTAEIESKIKFEMDEDIHSLFSMLGESAAEAQTEIVQRLEFAESQREEEIKTIVESDKQAETLFNFLGEESSNFLSEPVEEPKMEMSEEVEDFLGTLGGVDVFEPEPEVIEEPTLEVIEEIMDEMVEVLADTKPKDVVADAAEWMTQLDELKKDPALDDLGKLTKQVELIQNQLSTYKVGWGQQGMTYGSGEVRLEYLDDVDRTSAKTDGYALQYQASTDSWIGAAAGNPVVSGSTSGDTMTLVLQDESTIDINIEHAETYLLLEDGFRVLMEDSGYLVQDQLVGNPTVSGVATGDTLTLTQHDGSTIDIDITQIGDPFILLEDDCKIILEAESGFLMGNSTIASVVSGAVSDTTLSLTHQDDSVTDIDVTTLTNVDFEPSGYEYINDSSLYAIINDTEHNGLFVPEGEWIMVPCDGYVTNKLPTGNHRGIAGSIYWEGSGSKTYSRIWQTATSRFYFDELSLDTVVNFRFKVDMIPETNNTLVQARINFYAIRDGNDDPVLEDATIVEEYRITLEDGLGDVVDEDDGTSKFILELGTDMGQGDYPGSYDDTNYKVSLETATDGGTGQLKGDHFLAYNFQQTVAAQELADGGGVEQERTFIFPVYVGDSSSQRGYGHFEVFSTADLVINDSSVLSGLN